MAVACAAADLLGKRALDLDLVFLIEGEEESGSGGFVETVKRHKVCNNSLVWDIVLTPKTTGHDWSY